MLGGRPLHRGNAARPGQRPGPEERPGASAGRTGAKANMSEGAIYGGGAAAQPDADGGTACFAHIARTGAPRGAAPPHSVTIQAYRNMYKS
jgi:hypothetical protein